MRIPKRILQLVKKLEESEVQDLLKYIEDIIEKLYSNEKLDFNFTNISDKIWKLKLNNRVNDLHTSLSKKVKEQTIKMLEKVKEHESTREENWLLHAVLEQWMFCVRGSEKIASLFIHYDEFIKSKEDQNSSELPIRVNETTIKLFKEIIIYNYKDNIQSLIINMVDKHRKGGVVDETLIDKIVKMLINIDKEEVYMKIIEKPLIQETRSFYKKIAEENFDNCTTVAYLKEVKKYLEKEKLLAKRCFPEDIINITNAVSDEMIVKFKEEITTKDTGVRAMLKNKLTNELKLVYEILGSVNHALDPTIKMVKDICIEEGRAIIESKKENERELIMSFIELRKHYKNLLSEAFSKKNIADVKFSQAIKEAFKETVNANKQFPEYLSLVLDNKLKKGKMQMDDKELDEFFDNVILIFHHVKDKDYFEKYYNTHLAKRLLSGKSANEDAEKSFLKKLKEAFGYNITSKLEGMFKDMKLSEEMNELWKKNEAAAGIPFQLSVQMLTQTYWPVSKSERCEFPYPIYDEALTKFEEFYYDKHSGRKVNWQLNMGTADVRANGYVDPYEFTVSTHQMVVLLLFNSKEKLSVSEIAELTKIPINELKRTLISLTLPLDKTKKATSRLLLKKFGESKKFDKDTDLRPNTKFSSQKTKMRVIQASRKENDEQRKDTKDRLMKERHTILEAVIVRIMKQHKTLSHMELSMEVNKQIQARFSAPPKMFKQRVESLIERNYLNRSDTDRKVYNYHA